MVFSSFKLRYKTLFFGLFLAAQTILAQVPNLDLPLNDVLAVDSGVRIGKLENGLTYYIRKNKKPEKQAIIELVVKAGSLHEKDHEQGLAHYLEHVVFKGSKHFQDEKEFENYFSSRGIQFAADNNAFTTFDKTGYFFVIPTDNQDLTDKTFAALGDFAGRAFLKDAAVETERAIILDELQVRNSVMLRQFRVWLPVLMQGTDYQNRIPAGIAEVISTATPETIRNFYATWYNPNNMAVVAVGDFEPDNILELIKKHCGDLKNSGIKSDRVIKTAPTPKHGEVVFFVDRENTTPTLQIFFDQGNYRIKTVRDLRDYAIVNLASTVISQRMLAAGYEPDAPANFMAAGFAQDAFKDFSCTYAVAGFKQNKHAQATEQIITMLKQVADHGVGVDELMLAKKSLVGNNHQLIANADSLPHGFFKNIYDNHVMTGDYVAIASVVDIAALINALVEDVTELDITTKMQQLFDFKKAVYLFSLSEASYAEAGGKDGEVLLRKVIADTSIAPTNPYIFAPRAGDVAPLMQGAADARSIEDIQNIDAKKIVLANGVVVYYKKTTFTDNIIDITGFAQGGMDMLVDDYITAKLAVSAVDSMGFGGIKPFQWHDLLSDKPGLRVGVSMTLHGRGVSASCRKEDLSFCLNLTLANMLQPNSDEALFSVFTQNVKTGIRDVQNSPQALFYEKNNAMIFGHPVFFKPLTEEMVDQLALDASVNLYHRCFDNIGDFVFAVSGNIELEELLPLLNQTFAMVPVQPESPWTPNPIEISFPSGACREVFDRKAEQQTTSMVTFPFSVHTSFENERLLDIYQIILNKRLVDVVRFDNNKSYSPQASAFAMNDLFIGQKDSTGRLICNFSSSKENINVVIDLIIKVLADIKATGFTAEEIANTKQIAKNHLVQDFKSNGPWNAYMIDRHVRGNGTFDSIDTLAQFIDGVTVEQVNAFAQELVDPSRYYAHSLVAAN